MGADLKGPAEAFKAWCNLPPGCAMESWEFVPYEHMGELRAVAALDGTEIHFAIAPAFRHRVIARWRTRAFLAPLLERRGFLTTRAEPGRAARDFLTRLGFAFTWNDGQFDHFMLTELPFGTEN